MYLDRAKLCEPIWQYEPLYFTFTTVMQTECRIIKSFLAKHLLKVGSH